MRNFLPENSRISSLATEGGMLIRTGYFPAKGEARASLLLVGGHREFIEKYTELIEGFQRRGFDVYHYDHRGQGGSGRMLQNPAKSHNPDFGLLVRDMDEVVRTLMKPQQIDHPLYLVAHSMGAQLALRYLHDYPGVFDRAVLYAPFVNFNIGGPMYLFMIKLYAWVANALGFSSFFAPGQARCRETVDHDYAFSRLTHDRTRYDASQKVLSAKPELFVGGVTFGWLRGVTESMKTIRAPGYISKVKTPLLVLLAGEEKVVDNDAGRTILSTAPNVQIETIEGARHEIYRESDKFRDQLLAWTFGFLI